MARFFYIILIVTILPFCGIAQNVTPTEELDYTIEEFTLPGGRLGNNVNDIVQGPYGFMWFGSHGGLHRYDGYEFVTYNNVHGDSIGETTSLSYQYVEDLFWDSSKTLWITTYGGGIFRFDPKTERFKHYSHDPDDSTSISHPRVLSVVEDAMGNLWFGTEGGGLNRFDSEKECFTRYYANPNDEKSLSNDIVRTLYVDKAGTLWAGTGFIYINMDSGALSRYDPDSDSFDNFIVSSDSKSQSPVRGIFEDSRGNFWIGTTKGLYRMDRALGTFEFMNYSPGQPFPPGIKDLSNVPVYSVIEDQNGGLWIGTILDYSYKSHLLRFDPESNSSQILPVQSAVWQLFESTDGTIWVAGAGDSGKVLKIRPKAKAYDLTVDDFFYINYFNSPLRNELEMTNMFGPLDIAFDPNNGTIWVELLVADPTFNSFQVILGNHNPKTGKTDFHSLPDLNLQGNSNRPAVEYGSIGLIVDNNGGVWSSYPAENVGIYHYDPTNKHTEQYLHDPEDSTSLSSNDVITIMQDSRGEIWAATYGQGLNRLDPVTGSIMQYHFNQDPWSNNDFPIALMEGNDGKIWVSGELTTLDGVSNIVVIDPYTDEIQRIPVPSQYTFNVIPSIAQSPTNGKIIFTLYNNGIGSYDPETGILDFYNTSNSSFPFDEASGVVCDNNGVFWVMDLGNGRLVRIGDSMDFYTIQESSGIGGQWRSGVLGPNGHVNFLSYGGGFGWIDIDPKTILPESSSDTTRIRLVSLTLLGEKQKVNTNVLPQPIWMIDKIRLPNEAQSFGFRFSDFDFQNSSPQFQYRLYPFENQWTINNAIPIANYYKIPPGDYTFQVKSNRSGFSQDRIVELNIVVLPPWWQTLWAYTGYGLIFITGVFFVDRYQRKRLLARATAEAKEKELAQAREIEKAYTELKITQAQLIQSEKMASLGELTAGIAHEIQNPLNFVNNFSDVNMELTDELLEEVEKGNKQEAKAIIQDIRENEEKILHHGKRADAIVKGMLQHSRTGGGEKELTDINALCDEYLRLSYHGLRAKDKTFNADFKIKLDPNLPKVNVIPQDIGRVLLNLINNAFFAVSERAKNETGDYKPTVVLRTTNKSHPASSAGRLEGGKGGVQITVSDNGSGIPQNIRDKIFQPFFTTKAAGQGTGLGLSLSYDIITKGHGGQLKVESSSENGTSFLIILPD